MANFVGVIIEESLVNKDVLKKVKIVKTEVDPVTEENNTPEIKQWTLHTVEIPEDRVDGIAEDLSKSMGSAWYADFKNASYHYIVFHNKVFKVDRFKPRQYDDAVRYGLTMGIPDYQLDFSSDMDEWER